MNIVIIGSLGHIGKPLTQELIRKENNVTVITRNAGKQTEIEQLGATAAVGSLSDVPFLTKALTDADAIFCMVPPGYAEPDQIAYYENTGATLKQAIIASGVKRVVHLSSYGAHLPSGNGIIAGSYRVEQAFNSIANIQLTHVRPTYFYYNLLAFIPMIKAAGFIGAVYGDTDQLTLVSPEDIAAAVAEELQKSGHIAALRYIASDQRSCNEIAQILGKAIGMPDLKWLILPKEDVLDSLKAHGLTEEFSEKLVELGEAIHTGKLNEDYNLHTPASGNIKLEDYAKEFAQAFGAK